MKKRIIKSYKERNDRLFHLFDHMTLQGTKLIIKLFIAVQLIALGVYGCTDMPYLSIAGAVLSLLLTLYYLFRINDVNRRSAIYKLFAWILILPSFFDLGADLTAQPLVWEDIAINTLFLISGIAIYKAFLKLRRPKEPLLLV